MSKNTKMSKTTDGRTDDDGRTTTTDDGRRRTTADGRKNWIFENNEKHRENTCFLHIPVVVRNSFSQNNRKMSKRNLVIKPSKIHRQKMLYPDLCRIFHAEFGYTIRFWIHGLFDEFLMISHFVFFDIFAFLLRGVLF